MIRIGVVEDDPASIDLVLSHLDRFQTERGERLHVATFRDGSEILNHYRPDWDVLFLDIQMADVDGMTAARRIRAVDKEVLIVFVTSSPHYAVSGYAVDALSYLLKPLPYAAFKQEMDRCFARLQRRERRQLMFTAIDGVHHLVGRDDIMFIETVKRHLVLHTLDGNFSTVTTMRSMEAELGPDHFFRCNSGYLVNLRHVTAVDGNACRLRDGAQLQVSRPRKRDFLAALAAYIGEQGMAT